MMTAQPFVPDRPTIPRLRDAAEDCQGCDLYRHATQVVFSSGPRDADIVLVGEQPGDVEDKRGEPFVGPAGELLRKAMTEVGIDASTSYLTNAVKHFKFEERGKRRIHQKPGRTEIVACRPWLVAEMLLLKPSVLVILGATAAEALMGPGFRVTRSRGQLLPWPDSAAEAGLFGAHRGKALATIHPSAVLRANDRSEAFAGLVADLRVARSAMRGSAD
jgi:DNA polymerase